MRENKERFPATSIIALSGEISSRFLLIFYIFLQNADKLFHHFIRLLFIYNGNRMRRSQWYISKVRVVQRPAPDIGDRHPKSALYAKDHGIRASYKLDFRHKSVWLTEAADQICHKVEFFVRHSQKVFVFERRW